MAQYKKFNYRAKFPTGGGGEERNIQKKMSMSENVNLESD